MGTWNERDEILELLTAGARVLHVVSHEWQRVEAIAIKFYEQSQREIPLYRWNQSIGSREYQSKHGFIPHSDECDFSDLLVQIYEQEDAGIWILEDVHHFFQDPKFLRWIRELARQNHSYVLLVSVTGSLPIDLQKEVPTVRIQLPGANTLKIICEQTANELGIDVVDDERIWNAVRGMTVMEAKIAFGRVGIQYQQLGIDAIPALVQEKKRIIEQSRIFEFHAHNAKFGDIGGLDLLKDWLQKRGRAFSSDARSFGLESPKGVLLLGVQGCGKSLIAKSIAATWQLPLLRFDMGKIFGGVVGESEGNMRMALELATTLAPCILWIDEIEKGLAGMGSSDQTDGGTTARVVGSFLTWMQEKKEEVFVVATANRIDSLPPELLRKGRFDEIFFVDLPSAQAREEILSIHLRKKQRDPSEYNLPQLAKVAQGFSGAELEEAIKEALFEAYSEGKELQDSHIITAIERTYPLSQTMSEMIVNLRKWARVRARPACSENTEPIQENKRNTAPRLKSEQVNPFV